MEEIYRVDNKFKRSWQQSIKDRNQQHAGPADLGQNASREEEQCSPTRPYSLCNGRNNSRRRHRTVMYASAAALIMCSSSMLPSTLAAPTNYMTPAASFVNPPTFTLNTPPNNSMSILSRKAPTRRSNFASNFPPNTTSRRSDTWSDAVRQKSGLSESRFGVRRRVKSVLDKAKKRTGIDNLSAEEKEELFVQSGPNIVAETASIGGFGSVTDEDECVDKELDFISTGGKISVEEIISSESISEDTLVDTQNNGVTAIFDTPKEYAPISAPTDIESVEDDSILKVEIKDTDVIEKGDSVTEEIPAASSVQTEPLPFTLPTLTADQHKRAMNGERVQFQDDMGRAGSGFVVWDVKAPSSVVWDCLLDFQSYPQTIPTVREVVMYTNTHLKEDYRAEKPLDFEDGTAAICKHGVPSVTRAQFSLSKFRLKIAAVHKYRPHPKGDYMTFTLDPASRNMVLKYAKGIWHTQSNPDGKEGYTRVWLLCELRVSRLLPQWIVDYAAARAMPRATTWLKPQVEAAATLWLKDSTD